MIRGEGGVEGRSVHRVGGERVTDRALAPLEPELDRMLVEERLAACANVVGPIRSIYLADSE